jgi:hypothetical protein
LENHLFIANYGVNDAADAILIEEEIAFQLERITDDNEHPLPEPAPLWSSITPPRN